MHRKYFPSEYFDFLFFLTNSLMFFMILYRLLGILNGLFYNRRFLKICRAIVNMLPAQQLRHDIMNSFRTTLMFIEKTFLGKDGVFMDGAIRLMFICIYFTILHILFCVMDSVDLAIAWLWILIERRSRERPFNGQGPYFDESPFPHSSVMFFSFHLGLINLVA